MYLPPRRYVALAFVAAAGLFFALRPRPPEPDDPPDADPTEQLSEVVHLRIQAKARIAREVIAGRRPLLEAAALFRELDRLPPVAEVQFGWIPVRLPFPTRTEEEKYCRSVAVWVWTWSTNARTPGDDSADERAAAAVARLVAEFENERGRCGAIRLPDSSALESAAALIERVRVECGKSLRRP